MNQNPSKKPFLPRDKPKSWIVFIICGLAGVLIAGPLAIAGILADIQAIKSIGTMLFWCCWIVAAAMWFVYISRSILGHYKSIEDRDWRQQVW